MSLSCSVHAIHILEFLQTSVILAYLNLDRLSIHQKIRKWRSTMTPNTVSSVNCMSNNFPIVQSWLKLWHSLWSHQFHSRAQSSKLHFSNAFFVQENRKKNKWRNLFKLCESWSQFCISHKCSASNSVTPSAFFGWGLSVQQFPYLFVASWTRSKSSTPFHPECSTFFFCRFSFHFSNLLCGSFTHVLLKIVGC